MKSILSKKLYLVFNLCSENSVFTTYFHCIFYPTCFLFFKTNLEKQTW